MTKKHHEPEATPPPAEPVAPTPLTDAELLAMASAQPGEMAGPGPGQIEATEESLRKRAEEALGYSDEPATTIARICHEVNRVYCQSLGDDSFKPWDDAEGWQRETNIKGVKFHMANSNATPAASHDSWMAEKVAAGWVYGPSKDLTRKTHPCIMPYESLPKEQQFKDSFFKAVVDACRPRLAE